MYIEKSIHTIYLFIYFFIYHCKFIYDFQKIKRLRLSTRVYRFSVNPRSIGEYIIDIKMKRKISQ